MLCAVLTLLLVGYLLHAAQGRWLAPGPFFALFWAVALAAPPLLAPDSIVSQSAVWYIVVLVTAFGLGTFVGGGSRPPARVDGVNPRPLNLRLLRALVLVGTGCGLLATVAVQLANGYSVSSILSARSLLDSAAAFSIERYAGDTRTPPLVPLLAAFTYAAALLAPFAARGLSRPAAITCYVGPFLGASVYAVATTERLGMLTVGFFLFAGWIADCVQRRGEVPQLRLRSLLAGGVAFAVLAAAFVTVAFLRVGTFDASAQRAIGPKLVAYAVGYMPAFSQWLPTSPTGPATWGTATFAGLFDVGSGQSAAFAEFVPVGGGYGVTNVFTAWRYLVEDFGWAGAPLAAFVLGWIAAAAWRRVIYRPTASATVVLLAAYAYMLNSTTQTAFLFTNIMVAFVVAGVALCQRPPTEQRALEPAHERDIRRARERAARMTMTARRGTRPSGDAMVDERVMAPLSMSQGPVDSGQEHGRGQVTAMWKGTGAVLVGVVLSVIAGSRRRRHHRRE